MASCEDQGRPQWQRSHRSSRTALLGGARGGDSNARLHMSGGTVVRPDCRARRAWPEGERVLSCTGRVRGGFPLPVGAGRVSVCLIVSDRDLSEVALSAFVARACLWFAQECGESCRVCVLKEVIALLFSSPKEFPGAVA